MKVMGKAQPPADAGAEPGQQAGQRPDGTPVRVLVVDDEPSLAELLASVLRYEGWEVRTAGDRRLGAVRTAREFQPDAVVLDVMLPDLSGLEVLQAPAGRAAAGLRAVPDRARRRRGPGRRASPRAATTT